MGQIMAGAVGARFVEYHRMSLLKTLHLIATGTPLAPGFFGVPTRECHWLIPISREGLRQVDWLRVLSMAGGGRLPGLLQVRETGSISEGVVELAVNDSKWQAKYGKEQRERELGVGGALDIRIWPNFCFPVVPMVPPQPKDRMYYFRIRQKKEWDLGSGGPLVLARMRGDDGKVTGCEVLRLETAVGLPSEPERFRLARFYCLPAEGARRPDNTECPGHAEPLGLYFENKGLLLFRFHSLPQIGQMAGVPWRVGIDFGTSNTCVAILPLTPGMVATPKVGQIVMQTATMHQFPSYREITEEVAGTTQEGAAAVLDFPFCYASEALINDQYYFPSQFITRLADPPKPPDFRFEHGFILARNGVLDLADAQSLLDGHPPLPKNEYRVFRLVQDVKWSNRPYRRAFLWHLYKLLTMHAARHGARIAQASFSFPQAFKPDDVKHYQNEVISIFEHHGRIPMPSTSFVSESIAVQRRFQAETTTADRVVIDVGGGTSDYTGLLVGAKPLQASYCLAARYVNDYFGESPVLREVLRDNVYAILGGETRTDKQDRLDRLLTQLQELHKSKLAGQHVERLASFKQAAMFGLLGMLPDAQFRLLAERLTSVAAKRPEPERKTLCGFYLTLVVLYAALAFQGTRLIRQHRRRCANLQLDFIGNGSRYLLLLDGPGQPFYRVLASVVKEVWPADEKAQQPAEVLTRISTAGKAYVAEGLVLGSEGITPAEVVPDTEALRQFSAVMDSGQKIEVSIPGGELKRFVSLLVELLPGGKYKSAASEAATLIPHCQPQLDDEFKPLLQKALKRAREQIKETAAEHAKWRREAEEMRSINVIAAQAKQDAANSIEPVFITCVRSLLDEIRSYYAC